VVAHTRVPDLYADILQKNKVIEENAVQEMKTLIHDQLKEAYEKAKNIQEQHKVSANIQMEDANADTRVAADTLI
ncbi:hypothetical protein, partial [Cohnella sp. REN36]|uniref:hypothetical protein n=1 Tax=Cohnella sp. REN36 TaxID=2887347 RepID=UPI001D15B111